MEDKISIVLSGYPKSGTTWATRLMAQLLECPASGYLGFKGATIDTEGTERKSNFVCYKSHHTYEELKRLRRDNIKIIYMVRDPRDVVVSGAFHFLFLSPFFNEILQWKIIFFSSLIKKIYAKFQLKEKRKLAMINVLLKGDKSIIGANYAWSDHVDSYINKKDVLLIKYEDLLINSEATAKKMLAYCGMSKSDSRIKSDLEAQSFDVRKREFMQESNKIKSMHLRKGIAGDWENHLSISSIKAIEKPLASYMQRFDYKLSLL